MIAAQSDVENQDLFLDSAALNLHDFYTGLERIFSQIAKVVDNSMPSGQSWHRDLLNQMGKNFSRLRPRVLSAATIQAIECRVTTRENSMTQVADIIVVSYGD